MIFFKKRKRENGIHHSNTMTRFFELFAKNVRSLVAVFTIVLGFLFLFALLIIKVPDGNEAVLNVAAGLVLAGMMAVYNYYFGSSKDKSDTEKSDMDIARNEAGLTPPTA